MLSFSSSCKSKTRLDGKIIVITGANIGIGKEAARDFYRRGARVILACRDLNKANAAAEDIKTFPPSKPEREQFKGEPGEIKVCKLNLCSLSSVQECAAFLLQTEPTIDILVNNAGVAACPYQLTEDGYEVQFQTNHLGHFLLTLLLLPKLKASPSSRIVNVSSKVHTFGHIDYEKLNSKRHYSPLGAYARSKLANVLFTKELAQRLKEANINSITVYALHPGVINTAAARNFFTAWFPGSGTIFQMFSQPFTKTMEQGAQTTIYCSVDEEVGKESGEYYQECAKCFASALARDKDKAIELWNKSCEMIGIKPIKDINEFLETSHSNLLNPSKK
ncbi:retinol dehydrogenase 12-like isoform X1 [Prorops nasuta]|uniref:retinol dehydrogenase 12-like isoform X1 n=1 Tax=Prorops nasuta TaxID=863751 RepID=UPI0034CD82A4